VTVCTHLFTKLGNVERRSLGMPELPLVIPQHPLGGLQVDAVIKAFKGTGATIQKVWQDNSLVVYIAFPKDQETKERFVEQIEKYDFPLGCSDVIYWKLWANREIVCTKRVVGTETVEVEKIISQETETISEEREIVEWDCHPLLGVK